ncbi:MAG: Rrf2 family transcriptional regulator [Acidobacteriota bacterium]
MQLSLHADYGLRVLVYLGAHPGRVVSTQEISQAYGISKNHLVRVVQTLDRHGYVKVTAGRSGGVRLAKQPGEIRLGEVVRDAEPNLNLVECFDTDTNLCPIIGVCGLQSKLKDALAAFLGELNKYTLSDLMGGGQGSMLAERFVQLR